MFAAVGVYKVDWIDRTLAIMAEKRLTQIDLADAIGYSQSGMNRILSRKRSGRVEVIERISKALGTSTEHLLHGIDRPADLAQQLNVPVLTAASEMTLWKNSAESVDKNAVKWIGCPLEQASSRTFAYRVESDDMNAPYTAGCYVFVDPEIELRQGADVLFRMGNGCVAFRQYEVAAGQIVLMPRNNKYPAITASEPDITYLGTVIGALIINN